eukprot:maker-scaffold_1-snap-gene-31.37-mRNA-1 protein AED:0.01 eAED:0.01 QI:145/1/1/1/1/1/2/489/384
MGQCLGGAMSEEEKRNKLIEADMRKAQQRENAKIKLLLLGAGESGKSTLFKQMKLLYTERHDFTDTEREKFRVLVHSNIIHDMKVMITAVEKERRGFETKKGIKAAKMIQKWKNKEEPITEAHKKHLARLWKDPVMKQKWEDRGDVQVQDSLEYFMKISNIERIASGAYLPNNQDILRTRARTSGVVTETFKVDSQVFEMSDVGGQRNERKKWIAAFDGVTSVIFVAACSEYNQFLYEDSNMNRQTESLTLFNSVLRESAFSKQPFILFLNKEDLLREKLRHIPFTVDAQTESRMRQERQLAVPVFRGGQDSERAFEDYLNQVKGYLQALYESEVPKRDGRPLKSVHTYFTNSTDSQNINKIINSCKHILMTGYLEEGGWLDGY